MKSIQAPFLVQNTQFNADIDFIQYDSTEIGPYPIVLCVNPSGANVERFQGPLY